jgi:hypothetical protein
LLVLMQCRLGDWGKVKVKSRTRGSFRGSLFHSSERQDRDNLISSNHHDIEFSSSLLLPLIGTLKAIRHAELRHLTLQHTAPSRK